MKNLFLFLTLVLIFQLKAQDNNNLVAMGNQAMNEGNFKGAERFYLSALAKDNRNYLLYTYIGFSLHKQNYFSKADSFFQISINNDSTLSKAFWYKGMNLVKMKKDSLAILSYKKFIQLERKRGGNSLVEANSQIAKCYERILRKDGLYSFQIDDMLNHLNDVLIEDLSSPRVPVIENFIEHIKQKRPASQTGKWVLTQ